MDPLSVAGSVAGLISLGDVVFRTLYHYVKEVKNAEQEVLDLKNEVAALNGVLHNLHLIAQDLEDSSIQHYSFRPDHINACLATLYKLNENINQTGLFHKGSIRTAIKKLTWPFKAANTKQFIEDIRQHRNSLSFALSADTLATLIECLSKQDELLQGVMDLETILRERKNIETRIALDDERQTILDYFLFVNPEDSFRTSLRLRYPTTGFWLTENETFTTWLRASNANLWLSGIPGAGKTVLSGLVIQRCMTLATSERAVAYFYCDYKDKNSQSIVNIMGSLASQLARQHENSFKLLKDYFATLQSQHQLPRMPEIQELTQLIRDMSSIFEDVRLVVDGLDECGDNAGAASLALRSLVAEHDSMSACFLSRDVPDIFEVLQKPFCSHIEIAAHTKDVDHYVRTEVEERLAKKQLRLKSNGLKEEIITQLVSRASGMFRWVSCQLDHLCELPTDALRRKALTQLPLTLFETYERLLMRVPEPSIPLFRRTLQWIAYADPSLSIEELTEIVSIDEDDETLDPEACPDAEDLLRLCGSLIRRTHLGIELAHFTVQEFLDTIKPDQVGLSRFRAAGAIEPTLAKHCVAYLCLPQFTQLSVALHGDSFESYKFYFYACRNLPKYLDSSQNDEDLIVRLQKLFGPQKAHNLANFLTAHLFRDHDGGMVERLQIWTSVCSHEFGSLHAAAMLHIAELCRRLVSEGSDVNQISKFGTPLECAVYGTKFAVQKITDYTSSLEHLHGPNAQNTIASLLDNGANCDPEVVHDTSLGYALLKGPMTAPSPFFMMLAHGMQLKPDAVEVISDPRGSSIEHLLLDVNQIEDAGITPEVKMLLLKLAERHDVDVSIQIPSAEFESDETYFDVVAYTIRQDAIAALTTLAHDSRFCKDVGFSDTDGTLLHFAARMGSLKSMEFLIDLGFDPGQLNDKNRTVLHEAVGKVENEVMLRKLVEKSTKHIADNRGETAWHAAAYWGHLKVLELLISHHGRDNPSLWQVDDSGLTPILTAIWHKETECASLLLSAYHLRRTASDNQQILGNTITSGFHSFLQELLDQESDASCTVFEHNRTALYCLSSRTTNEMLDLLFSHGLDPDHLDDFGRSPLMAYLNGEHRDIFIPNRSRSRFGIRLPQEHGLLQERVVERLATPSSATSRDSDGKTAWYYFCTKFVPFVLTQKERDYHRVSHVLSVLVQHDALRAHEEATNESGMGLIVKECLQQNSSHYGRYGCIQLLGSILFEVISTANRAELDMRHPELVRLLIWSMLGPVENLFQKLLEFGADIHAASMYYGDDSAMDCYLRSRTEIAPGVTELLLAHAQADLIPKTDPRGWLKHFCLCAPQPGTTDRESTRVVKLEAILKIGVDPNARSKTLTTAAMVAAGAGSLDVLRLLVLHNADMDLTDEFDWTVVQHAVWGGQVDVLKYLHSQIQGGEQWTQLVSFLVPLGAAAMPMGPSDARSYFGCTLAHFASYRPEMATLQFLKEAGVLGDINARAQEGVTPLHLAVCVKAPAATRWLIRNGADVKATFGMKKSTALHTAFRMGNAENAFALLEAGAELSTDSTGMTPERYGSRSVLYDLLRLISYSPVKIPRAIHQALKQERTGSLYSAIVSGNLEACRSIAQVTMVLNKPLAECGTCTPLIVALVWQRPDIARLFLELGASTSGTPCARTRSSGPSRHKTLYIAISQPIFNSILEQLLERSLVDEAHWTQDAEFGLPLHLAAAFNPAGLKILVEHLVKHGIFFSRERNSRWIYQKAHSFSKMLLGSRSPAGPFVPGQWLVPSGTPLHVAAWNRKLEAVDVLLDLGVDVDARDNGGWTPLHHATKVGCVDTISKLLQRGATPRACDRIGRTPLMILVCTGTLKAVAIMVALETDKTSADVNGKTALHYAVLAWRLDVLIYLIKMGWDAYQLDKSGRSPVCYALSSPRLASYIYATHLDLTHLVSKSGNISTVKLSPSTNSTRSFYRYLPQTAVVQYLKSLLDGVSTPLMSFAFLSQTQGMRILIESGAELEDRNRSGDTALIVACREGQLPSVVFLVRQGAKLEYTYDSRLINALKSASSHAGVIKWFLVDRWADQDKLTSEPFNSEAPAPLRPWTGVRTVKIPLRGTFARPVGSSLMIHAKYLHSIARNGWRNMVPLGWNTVAHLVPLPAEPEYPVSTSNSI